MTNLTRLWNLTIIRRTFSMLLFIAAMMIVTIKIMYYDAYSPHELRHVEEPIADKEYEDYANETVIDMRKHIAIGCALTSKGRPIRPNQKVNVVKTFDFFIELLPTFCTTASSGFYYYFYISYDYTDVYFRQPERRSEFKEAFDSFTKTKCKRLIMHIRYVQCSHFGKPAWAQNDGMMEAYIDNMEYFYRINDDTKMKTKDWTRRFIGALQALKPPYVGVVGPRHSGGNTAILTYDFVHKTHLEIFGFYYPRNFLGWFADRWITDVYRITGGRMKKLSNVKIKHTMSGGTRYPNHRERGKHLRRITPGNKLQILRYIQAINITKETGPFHKEVKVIAMSLHGEGQMDMYGAIRNAQLRRVFFPHWKIRFYVEKPRKSSKDRVSKRVINKLRILGAQIVFLNKTLSTIPKPLWPFLVVDDTDVDRFIIRRPRSRLNELDAQLVQSWMNSSKVLHCIRDHPSHTTKPIVEYLWGARNANFRKVLKTSMENLLLENTNMTLTEFLSNILWPKFEKKSLCHDSVSCKFWKSSIPMPTRNVPVYMGQPISAYEETVRITGVEDIFQTNNLATVCTK